MNREKFELKTFKEEISGRFYIDKYIEIENLKKQIDSIEDTECTHVGFSYNERRHELALIFYRFFQETEEELEERILEEKILLKNQLDYQKKVCLQNIKKEKENLKLLLELTDKDTSLEEIEDEFEKLNKIKKDMLYIKKLEVDLYD